MQGTSGNSHLSNMQYRRDAYPDCGEHEMILRRQAQAQIGRINKIEQRLPDERISEPDVRQRPYSSQIIADAGSSPALYDDYFNQDRSSTNNVIGSRKRYRRSYETETTSEHSNQYREHQQYLQPPPNIGFGTEALGDERGSVHADYNYAGVRQQQLSALNDFDGSVNLDNNNHQNLRFGSADTTRNQNQRQFESTTAAPPGYNPEPVYTGSGRSTFDDLDIAEKYCRDLYREEQELSERRKAAIQSEIQKIFAARSAAHPSHIENEIHQQRALTATTDSQQLRIQQGSIPNESMAAAELRSLLAAGRNSAGSSAGAGEVVRPYNDTGVGIGVTRTSINSRQGMGDAGQCASAYAHGPYEPTATMPMSQIYDRNGMGIPTTNQFTNPPVPAPILGAYTHETPPPAQVRGITSTRTEKHLPINIPSGKIYDKKLVAEMEARRHGSELRKLLSAPKNAEIWVETCTSESRNISRNVRNKNVVVGERKVTVCYFYNAVTGETVYSSPANTDSMKDGPVHIVKQEDLALILSKTVPQTIVLKGAKKIRELTESIIRSYFGQFGRVAFVKVVRLSKRSGAKRIAAVRMATLDAQERVLANKEHVINGLRTEVMISQNRLLISRLPDGCFPREISQLLFEQAGEMDVNVHPAGVAVLDTYMCTPFPQFCFATLRAQLLARKFSQIGDLLFRNHFYLNVCVVDVDLDAEAREVYARKMAEYTVIANSNAQMLHMIKALQSISGIIKQTLKFISESSKYNRVFTLRTLLVRLNSSFGGGCTEEETHSYHVSMELILEMCLDLANKLGILAHPVEFHLFVESGKQSGAREESEDEDTIKNELIDDDGYGVGANANKH